MSLPRRRPEYPIFFTKAPTAVAAPYADLPFDFKISEQLDWEVELGIVIGKPGKNIKQEDAMITSSATSW